MIATHLKRNNFSSKKVFCVQLAFGECELQPGIIIYISKNFENHESTMLVFKSHNRLLSFSTCEIIFCGLWGQIIIKKPFNKSVFVVFPRVISCISCEAQASTLIDRFPDHKCQLKWFTFSNFSIWVGGGWLAGPLT